MLVNTAEFTREAQKYQKYGYYCDAEVGSFEFIDYWNEQKRRCIEGYSVGGVKITGEHYGYLNFSKIKLTAEDNRKERVGKINMRQGKGRKKIYSFPDFWDGDYAYFWIKHIARWGITEEDYAALNLPSFYKIKKDHLVGGKHLAVAKARRKGYSYKNGWICAHQYNFEPRSVAVIGAFDKKYLYPEGTMQMASNYLNHLNATTAWAKRRLVDRADFKRSGYKKKIAGIEQDAGYLSSIIAVSFGDNPGAARGKDAGLVLFEEAGRFPNILDCIDATQDTMKDGIYMTGQMLIFGTGGGEDTNWEGFSTLFNTPDLYDILAIENILEESAAPDTFVSFFVPDTLNMKGYIDKDGNSKLDEATAHWNREFDRIRKESKTKNTVDNWLMEHPIKPSHSFKGHSQNIFPVEELKAQKTLVESNKLYKNFGQAGKLYRSQKGGVKFKPDETVFPINHFPHRDTDDLTGGVVIYQHPQKFENGVIPEGLYYIAHDPYAHTGSGISLGATYVFKSVQNKFKPSDVIVAVYHARPENIDDYNQNLFYLAEYYNCKIGFENDRGDVQGYAKQNGLLDYLEKEFELAYNKELASKEVNRPYGMHMTTRRKLHAQIYLKNWLLTKRGTDVNGNVVLNLHYIYDLATLEELIRFDPSPTKNFDRVSALFIAMYYQKEIDYKDLADSMEDFSETEKESFFSNESIQNYFR